MRAYSLMYHDVVAGGLWESTGMPGPHARLYKMDNVEFERHLDSIGASVNAVDCIRGIRQWNDCSPVFLTFDDGGVSFFSPIADLLERRNWRGHSFISTAYIGKTGFMNESQIRDLHRRGHVIGSHGVSHPPRMSALRQPELEREWKCSIQQLSAIIGEPVRIASVPGGFYSRAVAEAAAASGIEVLFTSEPTSRIKWVSGCMVLGRYVLRRTMSADWAGAFATGKKSYCLYQAMLWKMKRGMKWIAGKHYVQLSEIVFALRKGSNDHRISAGKEWFGE